MALNSLQMIIHEQFVEYSETLRELEKEIIRKYKAGEDYSADVTRAAGLKMLKEECIKMMVEKR
jgi:hypothetical protein